MNVQKTDGRNQCEKQERREHVIADSRLTYQLNLNMVPRSPQLCIPVIEFPTTMDCMHFVQNFTAVFPGPPWKFCPPGISIAAVGHARQTLFRLWLGVSNLFPLVAFLFDPQMFVLFDIFWVRVYVYSVHLRFQERSVLDKSSGHRFPTALRAFTL